MSTETLQKRRLPFDRKPLREPTNALRRIRLHLGLTLQQVADVAGASPQVISQAERGRRTGMALSAAKWCLIADALHISVQDLLNPRLEVEKIFNKSSINDLTSFK